MRILDLPRCTPSLLIFSIAFVSIAIGCTPDESPMSGTAVDLSTEIGMTANTVMVPVNIEFAAENPTDGASYFWDFGDGNAATGIRARHTYLDAGTFTVRLSAVLNESEQVTESRVTVHPGDAGWLVLNKDALILESAEDFQFEAEAFDHLGNPVHDPQLTWHVDPWIGTIDDAGRFVAGQNVGIAAEGVRVEFSRGNATVDAVVPVQVIPGDAVSLSITPPNIDTRVNWAVDLTAEVFDAAGHLLEDAEITWEALRPGDSIDQTGHYVPNDVISNPDASLVVVTATRGPVTLSRIVEGHIKAGVLDRVEVDGSLVELNAGDEVQLSAIGYDRFGHDVELDEVRWEVIDSEVGTVTADGLFTAGAKSGNFSEETVIVRGFKDGVQVFEYVPLRILPSAATELRIVNGFDSVPAGASAPIPIEVLDEFGNSIDDVDVFLEITEGGELTSGNVLKVGFDEGSFGDAIVARVLAGNAGNTEDLIETASFDIRQRSSDFIAIDIVGPRGPVVYLINLVTGELTPLTADIETNEYGEDTPVWWPDGSRVAYSTNVAGNRQIFDANPFTGETRVLVTGDADLMMPSISYDGTKIAFVASSSGSRRVYWAEIQFDADMGLVRPLAPDDFRPLTPKDANRQLFPFWHPDGDRIMFTSVSQQGDFVTNVASIDGDTDGTVATIAGASGFGWHPRDGRVLIVANDRDNGGSDSTLMLVDLGTDERERIDTQGIGVAIAAISPDGTELSFVDSDNGALWLMDLDGTGLRQAMQPQFQPTISSWRPVALELPTPSDRARAGSVISIPTGEISESRFDVPTHGTLGPYEAIIDTDAGEIRIDLYNHIAPITVENFVNLARSRYFDGMAFHTVEPGSAVFSGSKIDAFGGNAGYYIPSEFHPDALHDAAGTISMLARIVDGGSSEFVIALEPKPEWDAYVDGQANDCKAVDAVCYAVFGRVIDGLDVLTGFEEIDRLKISASPHRINTVTIVDRSQ